MFGSCRYPRILKRAAVEKAPRGLRPIEEAVTSAEIIEESSDDNYGPSLLLLASPFTSPTLASGQSGEDGEPVMKSRCPVCGGSEDSTQVTLAAMVTRTLVSIEHLPTLVCRQCGKEWSGVFSHSFLKTMTLCQE